MLSTCQEFISAKAANTRRNSYRGFLNTLNLYSQAVGKGDIVSYLDTTININTVFVCLTSTASQPHSLYLGSWVSLHMYM